MIPSIYLIGPERESSPEHERQFEEVRDLLHTFNVALHAPLGSQKMAKSRERANIFPENRVEILSEEIRKEFARDIDVLLSCNAVALLPDWSSSRGAVAEYTLAKAAGLPVFTIDVA